MLWPRQLRKGAYHSEISLPESWDSGVTPSLADDLRLEIVVGHRHHRLLKRIAKIAEDGLPLSHKHFSSMVRFRCYEDDEHRIILKYTAHAAKDCADSGTVLCIHRKPGGERLHVTTHRRGECPYVDYSNETEVED